MWRSLVVTCYFYHAFAANVLFVSLLPSPSHHHWNEAIIEGLLTRGHNITMIDHFPKMEKNLQYTLMKIEGVYDAISHRLKRFASDSALGNIGNFWELFVDLCKHDFKSPELTKLLTYPRDFFDLIIFDIANDYCYLPLIEHFGNPPTIGVCAFGMHAHLNDMIGHRTESYIPHYALELTDDMIPLHRVLNIFYQTTDRLYQWWYMGEMNAISKEFYGNSDSLEVLGRRISLIFPNNDPIFDYPQPFPPYVIPIGGIHIKKPKGLDNELQKVMDGAEEGVIFASMGTNIRSGDYGNSTIKAFVEAFSKVNVTVLWKFDDKSVEVSKNVLVKEWFSQKDILAHRNTKLFITHCGGLSSQEAIAYGVPIIGIPVYLDQHSRAEKLRSIGGGIVLKHSKLSPETLYDSIQEVLSNSRYKENVMKLSKLYREQPQTPMEKILMWTDYILKNGHLDHLSGVARDMSWYQMENYDLIFWVLVVYFTLKYLVASKYYSRR